MRGAKVTVTLVGPGQRYRDPEGRWQEAGEPIQVRAHVAPAQAGYSSRSDVDRHVDAGVLLIPRGTPISTEMMLELAGARSLPDGEYRVMHVTRTARHVRCMVLRTRAVGS